MAEQLSQAQIDALLAKMSSGEEVVEEETQKVKEYDFNSPKKFTKEQLKALDSIHETFGRLLSSQLSGMLRNVCDVQVMQIEEQRYYEYNNSLPDTSLFGLINFKPEGEHYSDSILIMNMDSGIGFYLIDRLLGGSGELHNLTRDYTEIELAILENVLGKVVVKLQDAWRNSIDCTARLTSVETNARLLQVIAPEEIIVIVMLNVKIGDMTAPMTICIPAESLEEVIDKFSVRYTRTNNRRLDPDHERIKKEILLQGVCNTDMKIQATFDRLELKLWEIMQLQPMDVIPLNKRIDDDVDITLGGVPWFTAKLGELDDKKAIKLNRCINPVEEPAPPGEDPEEDGEDAGLVGSEMRETRK